MMTPFYAQPRCLIVWTCLLASSKAFQISKNLSQASRHCKTSLQASRQDFLRSAVATVVAVSLPAQALELPACKRAPNGPSPNCLSTSSVKQLDLFATPWVYETTAAQVKERLASLGQVLEQDENSLRVRISRDEVVFRINDDDKVVTFTLTQRDDGIGNARQRLNEIQKRAQIFGSMGQEFASADAAPPEGPLGQLKAFYGLQSGSGYADVILN